MLTGFRRFLTALCLWAVARFVAAFSWRDARVLGPLGVEQFLLVGLLAGCLAVLIAPSLRDRRRARGAGSSAAGSDAAGPAGGATVRGIRADRRRIRSDRAPLVR